MVTKIFYTEIEQQLQMTENRCNTLKNQLEQMKRVCHKSNKDDTQRRLAKRSLSSDFKENIATKGIKHNG